ncbi:MAG TPA: DUF488 family protein [Rubricoccaceae bacterium]|jgi:uncharacterized protein YeaO (DUF488 family)|nr:DUF488 family protein [Rubricoccaceae bacterium]
MIRIKRAYDPPAPEDGVRVLVDRLWPRGLRKAEARIDWWARELAPSTELRTWFGHDPAKYEAFVRRYRDELAGSEALDRLRALADAGETVTLVYAARDEAHNNAQALRALLTS